MKNVVIICTYNLAKTFKLYNDIKIIKNKLRNIRNYKKIE